MLRQSKGENIKEEKQKSFKETRMKKKPWNFWKFPIKQEEEGYLSPVNTFRKTMNMSTSMDLLNQQSNLRLTQMNKSPHQMYLKREGANEKPIFMS